MVWATSMSSTPYRACVPQHKECHPRYITHGIYGYAVDNIEWVYTVGYVMYMMWVYTVGYLMYMMWVYTVGCLMYMMWAYTVG